MATYDHASDLMDRIAYLPEAERQGLRTPSRLASPRVERERPRPVYSDTEGQEGEIFYFIEPRPRNPWAVFGSIALLSMLVAGLVAIPLLHTDPLPSRQTVTTLYLDPPPAAPGGNVTKLQTPKVTSSHIPTTSGLTAPVHSAQKVRPAEIGTPGGVAGGVPGGVVGGVAGGVLSGMLSSTPNVPVLAKAAAPAPVKRMRIASRVAEANLIHDVPPQYPTEAGRDRIQGTVVLMAVIGADGTVKDVQVESGLPILAQAAIDAVKQWRYKPYMIDGKPVEVDSRITINFTLANS